MPNAIISPELHTPSSTLKQRIADAWLRDETEAIKELLPEAKLSTADSRKVQDHAADLVKKVRAKRDKQGTVATFMQQYDLSSSEGILLMCVAEALLRIPDNHTADNLIRDKLGEAQWDKHLGSSKSVLVNASTWGLMITGKMVSLSDTTRKDYKQGLRKLVNRSGEPFVRMAIRQAMKIMGQQFIMASNIKTGVSRTSKGSNKHYRYSFDMLGEAALTQQAADAYFASYQNAIEALSQHPKANHGNVLEAPSISVKLSALHPRYEVAKRERVMHELTPLILKLAQQAKACDIQVKIDAEEAARLELSLDIMEKVFTDPSLEGWNGFGIVIQAYSKRTPFVIDWLVDVAKQHGRRWCVRLVKGAYWDAEIKLAQEEGLEGYPLYTRKPNTDVSYLACARRLLDAGEKLIFPQFATHNAHTIAAVYQMAAGRPFEYQRLHGMGEELYEEIIGKDHLDIPCRVYAPIGNHKDLLPYLVRRLLENGANTSFINHVQDEKKPIAELVQDPCQLVESFETISHPRIPLPKDLFGNLRGNSKGANLSDDNELKALADAINAHQGEWHATPLVPGASGKGEIYPVYNPAERSSKIGEWISADEYTVKQALDNAEGARLSWDLVDAKERARLLEKAADMLEDARGEFMALCIREAGKSISSSVAEIREAADFLRYYASMARKLFGQPISMPGPTGELNELSMHGRGIFICISPWNFPLAIFTGQIAAALVAGNPVISKPAEQTTLAAYHMVKLLHQAGIPEHVLQLVPGDGAKIGDILTADNRTAGVAFTGSTETARIINRSLAARDAPIAALIAETGGQNAMISDSSTLPEQLIQDVIYSAFDSAGQRCSASRVLFVQEDVADGVIDMLKGAMDQLQVGDPALLSTDVGPVIDDDALAILEAHAERMQKEAKLIKEVSLDPACRKGTFFAPRAYEIASLDVLKREVFGPVLHVIRYKARELDKVIAQVNATGYGLTLGIHTRVDETADYIANRVHVGNCYVNRNQIGAIVGSQPFGGEGLSGTGPKAGGPHYLLRFATERSLSIDTTAAGGNASLLTLDDD